MQSMQSLIEGRTEAEWCREACRIGAYDCVGPDGKHIRTFTGERTPEKVAATIAGLKEQAERYDRTSGVGAVDLLQQHTSPEKFVSKADIDRAHGVVAASPGWLDDALRLLNDIRKDVRQSKFGGLQCDELERVLRDSSGVQEAPNA